MKAEPMKKRPRKPQPLSRQLAEIIERGPMTRYRLSKEAKVDASQLCRFVHGRGRLTTDSMDRIGKVLRLRLVQDDEPKRKGR